MARFGGFSLAERWTCAGIWTAGLMYAMYCTYMATKKFCIFYPRECNLERGWFLNLPLDRGLDWSVCLSITYKAAVWWGVHLIGAEVIRKYYKQVLVLWYLCIGIVFTTYTFGAILTLFLLAHVIAYFVLMHVKSKLLLWLLAFISSYYIIDLYVYLSTDRKQDFYTLSSVAGTCGWTFLRCLSYSLDYIDACRLPSKNKASTKANLEGLLKFLAYMFYLPLLNTGPVIMYDEFEIGISKSYQPWSATRLFTFSCHILRYLGWAMFADIAKHYVHYNNMLNYPQVITSLSTWAFYGLMYHIGFDFMLTYVVQYGLPGLVARAEQFSVPSQPICGAHVQMPTKMWRYFDRGLYTFLVKYIYIPCRGNSKEAGRKLFASFVTFCFIFIFHGMQTENLIWAALNFIAITLESIAKEVGSTKVYQQYELKCLSPGFARRLYIVLALPLEMTALVSNMYFFVKSVKVGNAFATHMVTLDWKIVAALIIIGYSRGVTTIHFEKYGKK